MNWSNKPEQPAMDEKALADEIQRMSGEEFERRTKWIKERDEFRLSVDKVVDIFNRKNKAGFAQAMAAEAAIWNRNASNRAAYKRLVKLRAKSMYWAAVKRKLKEWWKR